MNNLIKLFKIILLLIPSLGIGQEISTQLPVLSPQTPTTSQLGKYGEIQVNESTGTISPSIPLFDYNAGKINIPITLSYSGNGVKVNQDPTWVGVNWNLNPSGVITRQVKDEIDELTLNKKYNSKEFLDNFEGAHDYLDVNSPWRNQLLSFTYPNIDTEVDIFNYNFLGYSGSFYLDEELNTHLIKFDKEIEIHFIKGFDNKSEIIITTPDGDTYRFGGQNASESSKTFVNVGAGSTATSVYAQNAFYLHKINFLTGGSVDFEYENFKPTNNSYYKIGEQESLNQSTINNPGYITKRTIYNWIENTTVLKKISSTLSNQIVVFNTTNHGFSNRARKLNSVELKLQNQLIKKVDLEYTTIQKELNSSEDRYFLNNILFYNSQNDFIYDYQLDYNNLSDLPKKDSFAQDELGYFNGVSANTSLLPKNAHPIFRYTQGLSNRDANLNYATVGSLKKITYPTKGYSEFEYELPYKGKAQKYSKHYFSSFYNQPELSYSSHGQLQTGLHSYSTEYSPGVDVGGIEITQTTKIYLKLNVNAYGAFTHHNNVLLSIIKNTYNNKSIIWTNGETPTSTTGLPLTSTEVESNSYVEYYEVTLAPGKYDFKSSIILNFNTPTATTVNYVVANIELDLPNGFEDVYYAGLRVKSITTKNNNDETTDYKRFYYNSLQNKHIESYTYNPIYYYLTKNFNSETLNSYDIYNLTSNSVNNPNKSDSGHNYEYVTISNGGNNFENGGRELKFVKTLDRNAEVYGLVSGYMNVNNFVVSAYPEVNNHDDYSFFIDTCSNNSFANSTLLSETLIDKDLDIVKKNIFEYIQEINHGISNVKVYTFYNLVNGNIVYLYNTNSIKYKLKKKTTEDYFNGVKIDSKTTYFDYDSQKVSLPNEIKTFDSKNISKKTKIYYPSDIASIEDLSPEDQTNITLLTNKHNVSQIIKTEDYANEVLLGSKQVSFKNFNGNILPSIIRVKKGNDSNTQLEDKIIFHDYDFYGNPEIVSTKDGIKTKYVYNSRQQVILKLENFNNEYIIDDGTPLNTPCYYQEQYPNCMVTTYTYDDVTNNLTSVTDPKCNKITYEYDAFNRLKQVKDNNGKVLSENEYHYKN